MTDSTGHTLPTVGEPVAVVYRGKEIEAIHHASIAVVNADGDLTHYVGDPHHVTMARSSIKPFQVQPLLVTGAADHYGFTPRQLAIMCGSHNGSDQHREVVLANLKASGSSVADLKCGAHWPLFMQVQDTHPMNGEETDPTRHNCSGKHSGFLALTKFLGDDPANYLNPDSRTQLLAREYVCRITGFPEDKMTIGIDGCSAPNFAMTPYHLASGFRRLAMAEDDDPKVSAALGRARDAMQSYPEMFSGEGRFDLDLMRSFGDELVCKVGAEGLEGLGFRSLNIGIGVKIHDGNKRALIPVIIEVLKQLRVIANGDKYPYLAKSIKPEVLNNRKLVTGHVVVDFKLRNA